MVSTFGISDVFTPFSTLLLFYFCICKPAALVLEFGAMVLFDGFVSKPPLEVILEIFYRGSRFQIFLKLDHEHTWTSITTICNSY